MNKLFGELQIKQHQMNAQQYWCRPFHRCLNMLPCNVHFTNSSLCVNYFGCNAQQRASVDCEHVHCLELEQWCSVMPLTKTETWSNCKILTLEQFGASKCRFQSALEQIDADCWTHLRLFRTFTHSRKYLLAVNNVALPQNAKKANLNFIIAWI